MYYNRNISPKLIYILMILVNLPYFVFLFVLYKQGVETVISNSFKISSISLSLIILVIFVFQKSPLNRNKINVLALFFSCHMKKSRSFHIFNKQFYVCSRCTGIIIGIFISNIISFNFNINSVIYLLALIPLIVDGTVQHFTNYISNNLRRVTTGMLFGISVVYFYSVILVYMLNLSILLRNFISR